MPGKLYIKKNKGVGNIVTKHAPYSANTPFDYATTSVPFAY
jgi:hypothetical protein